MGMDVIGTAPRSKSGEHFRKSVFWWIPLWEFCEVVAPDIIPEDNPGYLKVGWGLEDCDARRLAERLEKLLDSGFADDYEFFRRKELDERSDEPCEACNSTGVVIWNNVERVCHMCQGTGFTRQQEAYCPFTEGNVEDFVTFLRDCGGFKIC